MKVSTDSCLFGAWVANKIEQKILQPAAILDIGTGTGLLSLLLAQKSTAGIDTVEIEEAACSQAIENFLHSPWSERLRAYCADIKQWQGGLAYDLIISNPPFYQNSLKSPVRSANYARHDEALTLSQLLSVVKANLSDKGHFAILLPFQGIAGFKMQAAEKFFYLKDELLVRQTPSHSYFRSMLLFCAEPPGQASSHELAIKEESGNYSDQFSFLLKDYYLEN